MLQQALSVLATLVLARLLTRADFGLVALATTVSSFAYLVLNVGLGPAIVRREVLERRTVDTLVTASVLLSTVVAAVLAGLAPFLGRALGQPGAVAYLRLLGIVVVLSTTAGTVGALLQRDLRYRDHQVVQVVATVVYVGLEIGLAAAGVGALCVVYGQIGMALVTLTGWATCARYRPRPVLDAAVVRSEVGFASGWLSVHGLSYLNKNADYWVVGRGLGPELLGAYYLAYVLPNILRQRLAATSGALLFPVFARLQDDPEATEAAYVRVVRLQLSVAAPALVGLAVLARPVVLAAFGPTWTAAAPALALLSLAALVTTVGQTLTSVALGRGVVRPLVAAQLAGLVAMVVLVVAAVATSGGLGRVAAGVLGGTVVNQVVQQRLAGRQVGLPVRCLREAGRGVVLPTLVVALVAALVARVVDGLPAVAVLALAVPAGAGAYLVAALVLAPGPTRVVAADLRRLVGRGR